MRQIVKVWKTINSNTYMSIIIFFQIDVKIVIIIIILKLIIMEDNMNINYKRNKELKY